MLFGVATADHQCEAYEARWEDVWDRWERDQKLTPRGRATDFWSRYPEDVALARSLGCTAFRFSISWARVEPEPGLFDPTVLHHYRELAEAVRAAGMEPVVTLLHNVWPPHLRSLVDNDFRPRFAAYATEVVRSLADHVRWWVTINEPDQLVFGYLKQPWHRTYRMPPGLPDGASFDNQIGHVRRLIRSLFLANAEARDLIKAARTDAMVAANPLLIGLPGWIQALLDWRTSSLPKRPPIHHWLRWLDLTMAALDGRWWHLGMAGQLPEWLCPRGCAGQQDYVGLDYYWGLAVPTPRRVRQLIDAANGTYGDAPVWPGGMRQVLQRASRRFPGQPVLIVENGCVTEACGVTRAAYLRQHVAEAMRARDEGVPLAGYLCWSITSNREWGLRFGPSSDFGVYHIDLDTDPALERVETESAVAYRELIARYAGS